MVEELHEVVQSYAIEAAAARRKLEAARSRDMEQRQQGDAARREAQLVETINAALARLNGRVNTGSDEAESFRLTIHTLDQLQPRIAVSGSMAQEAFSTAVQSLCTQLGRHWASWLDGPDALRLLDGARALALAPPAGLSLGVDGLEDEHAAHETAQRLIRLCLRADALARSRQVVSDLRHGAHDCGSSVQEDVRGAKQARESFRNSPTCGAVTTLRARAVKYAQSGARVAKRLAEQAKEAASDREQAATALEECLSSVTRAVRSVDSLYRILDVNELDVNSSDMELMDKGMAGVVVGGTEPASPIALGMEESARQIADVEEVEEDEVVISTLKSLCQTGIELLSLMQATVEKLASGSGNSSTVFRAAAADAASLCDAVGEAASHIVTASEAGGKLGRRLLSILGERLEQTEGELVRLRQGEVEIGADGE